MHDDLHRPLFVPDLLANAPNQQPGRPLLQLLGGAMLSVGDVRDAASRYQQALASFGVGKGSRVGMLSANRPAVLLTVNALDRKSTRLNSSHQSPYRKPSYACYKQKYK